MQNSYFTVLGKKLINHVIKSSFILILKHYNRSKAIAQKELTVS